MEITGSQSEIEAIDLVRKVHVAAINAGNAREWTDQFAEDSVQLPPHFPANLGKSAIRAWNEGFLKMFNCRFSLVVDEVRVNGLWAFERGRYNITITPKAGGASMDEIGKYITIYQRQTDRTWKIARDIWNSDAFLPTGA